MEEDKKDVQSNPVALSNDPSKDAITYEEANNVESNSPNPEWKGNEETARVLDHKAERALCFKLDIRLMPVLAIMCAFWATLAVFCLV